MEQLSITSYEMLQLFRDGPSNEKQ